MLTSTIIKFCDYVTLVFPDIKKYMANTHIIFDINVEQIEEGYNSFSIFKCNLAQGSIKVSDGFVYNNNKLDIKETCWSDTPTYTKNSDLKLIKEKVNKIKKQYMIHKSNLKKIKINNDFSNEMIELESIDIL